MDQHTVTRKDTGIRFLSVKPQLLKWANCVVSAWNSNKIQRKLKDYYSVEFLENMSRSWLRLNGLIETSVAYLRVLSELAPQADESPLPG
jgi:hypothetical protein